MTREMQDVIDRINRAQDNWEIGRALLRLAPMGEPGAGNKAATAAMKEVAKETGVALNTLRNYRAVAHAWPAKQVKTGASWETHRLLMTDQDLIKIGMTVPEAKAALKAKREEEEKAEAAYEPQSEGDDWIPLDEPAAAATAMLDRTGYPVPERLRDVFGDLTMSQGLKDSQDLRRLVKNMARWNVFLLDQHIKDNLLDVELKLKQAKPHAVCRRCEGEGSVGGKACVICRERGWMPEWRAQEIERDGQDQPLYPALAQ